MTAGRAGEWRTMLLIVAVHAGWLLLLTASGHVPWFVSAGVLAVVVAWHGSLQHELLHGHPFGDQRINDALGLVPLGLRLPYPVYARYHLRHHRCEHLTDPTEDSESYYLGAAAWSRLPVAIRWFWVAHHTLLGRMLAGPLVETVGVWRGQVAKIRNGERELVRWWATHAVRVAMLLGFAVGVMGLPLWVYLLGAYCGHSLTLVRSFCEHRWVSESGGRTAMVRSGPFWSLLFLNNNLHLTHHARPGAAWYRLPELATALGSYEAAAEDAGAYRGYGEVFRRYLVRPLDHPVHPRERLGSSVGRAATLPVE